MAREHQQQPHGLSAETISRLESKSITEEDFVEDQEPICPICHETMQLGSTINKIQCGHKFHKECITRWLQNRTTCPNCRYTIEENVA